MYGIACYKYSSIWASISLHAFWNIGGIFVIMYSKDDYGILQHIINSSNVFIPGGDYGMDASIISIVSYFLIIVVLLFSKKRNLKIYNIETLHSSKINYKYIGESVT